MRLVTLSSSTKFLMNSLDNPDEKLLNIKNSLTSEISQNTPQWWSRGGSNSRPPACKAGALPAELRPHFLLRLFFALFVINIRSFSHVLMHAPSLTNINASIAKKILAKML